VDPNTKVTMDNFNPFHYDNKIITIVDGTHWPWWTGQNTFLSCIMICKTNTVSKRTWKIYEFLATNWRKCVWRLKKV
jgi:hypothetical protein